MTTAAGSLQIVPESPPSALALRAADRGVASALESVLSDNTQRVYAAQWRLFNDWCADVGLRPLPASPSPWPATWPPGLAPAPALPPCASPPAPSPRSTSWPAMNRPVRTRVCAPF